MNNELMKIVQAVNDSRAEPVDIEEAKYDFISIYVGAGIYEYGSVHAVPHAEQSSCWQCICTVEEFKQCVKEMSEGYGKKESNMKDNKHPHHDLIVEWAKDTGKVIQGLLGVKWVKCFISDVTNDHAGTHEFRFKPREFKKGHWYPCLDDKSISVCMWNGLLFVGENTDEVGLDADYFDDIGESLGEIKFGE